MTGANTAEAEVPRKDADGALSIPPQAVGAAVSKLILATLGEFAVIYSRSPAHKHHTFADLERMFLPAALTRQVYVAEMMQKEHGARAPVAAVLWASVSEETDKRLSSNPWQRPRLRPDEWKGGDQLWHRFDRRSFGGHGQPEAPRGDAFQGQQLKDADARSEDWECSCSAASGSG